MNESTKISSQKNHPGALRAQEEMIKNLKSSKNWIEGTKIRHNWDRNTDSVKFIFSFPKLNNPQKDKAWESEIISTIDKVTNQHAKN